MRQINMALQDDEYDEKVWATWTGSSVQDLWEIYTTELKDRKVQDR